MCEKRMSQLFSKNAIKSAISRMGKDDIESSVQIVQELHVDYIKGNMKDETRYEQSFNELFFHKLLGYEAKENWHPKASTPVGSKIADVGLGFFEDGLYKQESVRVVVELKGSGTMLDKKQASYGGQSPVDQGFGYKTSFKDCPWLIVSNFFEIRLYRDNKQDFERRIIDELLDAKDDYYQLRKLIALLHKDNLIAHTGTSKTQQLLSDVRLQQEKITKDFYKHYKQLRINLIKDILTRNSRTLSVATIVEKAQKIIDRIIFIHFCEDRGLLPEGKLQTNIMRAYEADFTPWEVLKKYFQGVDQGSEKLGIPDGYNGGLFHEDTMLNSLTVGDDICQQFVDLGHYDFDDELSVNILGHIFEQSISDLEEIKSSLLEEVGATQKAKEAKSSKRKKDGIFYTPEYIVDYIVQNSLMSYLEEKEKGCLEQIGKKGGYKTELEAYQAYQHILQNVKVLDPACGSGAFLVKVFDYLFAENKRVGDIVGGLFTSDEIYKGILRNNIYGVDLNPESVEITKLSLWLKSAQKGKKLNNLDDNIKCGNSLIDDPAVAGDRAFDWTKEFADIMGAGGFDVIVGNPPYVNIDKVSGKDFLKEKYSDIDGFTDLYYVFLYLGTKILKKNGILGYIIPSYFFTAVYASNLRSQIAKSTTIKEIIDFKNIHIFADAGVHTTIIIYDNKPVQIQKVQYRTSLEEITQIVEIKQDGTSRTFGTQLDEKIKDQMKIGSKLIEEIGVVVQSMQTGKNEVFSINQETINKYHIEKELLKSFVKNGHIQKYYVLNNEKKLLRTYQVDLENYPNTKKYLEEYKTDLEKRYDIISRKTTRYDISNPRGAEYFLNQKEKIIVPYMAKSNQFFLDKEGVLNDGGDIRAIFLNDKKFSYEYVLAICNSSLLNRFHQKTAKLKGSVFEYFNNVLNIYPIKNISLSDQQPFIAKADLMLSLNKELHEKVDFVLRFLQSKFGIEKLSTKLQKFREYDFASFLKELKSKKLSMSEEAELMEFFDGKKKEIVELKGRIDATDREIDEMVYSLYGLTEEEREVVLGG